MRQDLIKLSTALLTAVILVGCGGGSSDVNRNDINQPGDSDNKIHHLTPQSGTQSKLFYGNSKHNGLGSLSNVQVIDVNGTKGVSRTTIGVRYPVVTTAFTSNANGSYIDLHTQSISYISESKPYRVPMTKGSGTESANSSVGTLTDRSFSYQTINYLGTKHYLTATDGAGNQILITPQMRASDAPLVFNHKTLETVTSNGYIVIHDADDNKSTTNELQKCNLDMSSCTKIADIGATTKYRHGRPYTSYDMTLLGDIAGTTDSIYLSKKKIFRLNKADGTVVQTGIVTANSDSYSLSGNEIFYLEDDNIYKSTLDGTVTQISNDGKATSIEAFTDDMVIYGGDDYMYAVAKDGSLKDAPIELSVTTKTRGQKYPFDLGIGKQYLYNLYSVDTVSGKNTFSACKLEDGKKECKENSYWSVVIASKNGTLNYKSTYKYTPYAYVRVDTTDNYGGGKVKAIDPKYPLEDGVTMGITENFNFQTFVNSRYDNDLIDSDGNIVLYAKNDIDFRGDAFLMNLLKKNSLVNVTNEASPEANGAINAGRDHCHGRKCTVCHSFAGGKIYKSKAGKKSAHNHTIRFEFEDGSEPILAKVRKGSGENFNTPLENLVGKHFMPVVVDENNTAVVHAAGYNHRGVEYFNCNYCHGRNGDLKYYAPNVITIED